VAYRICDKKFESISDRGRDCYGAWHLNKRAKGAVLYTDPTAIYLVLFLAHIVHGCPPLCRVDVLAVRHLSYACY
jgi:hypothetical protein